MGRRASERASEQVSAQVQVPQLKKAMTASGGTERRKFSSFGSIALFAQAAAKRKGADARASLPVSLLAGSGKWRARLLKLQPLVKSIGGQKAAAIHRKCERSMCAHARASQVCLVYMRSLCLPLSSLVFVDFNGGPFNARNCQTARLQARAVGIRLARLKVNGAVRAQVCFFPGCGCLTARKKLLFLAGKLYATV